MFVALLLITQAPKFQEVGVLTVASTVMRSFARCTVLTDNETIAGFACESTGVHGETSLAKPFVWSRSVLTWLPLPSKSEYGHVYDGNDEMLVGSVDIEYRDRPAVWRPDIHVGWAKPRLEILSMNEGHVTCLAPDGTLWVAKGAKVTGCFNQGKWRRADFGEFSLAGIDKSGRIFGNRIGGYMEGGWPSLTKALVLDHGAWRALRLTQPRSGQPLQGEIEDVNLHGIAVGACQSQAVIWRGAKPELLFSNKDWSMASDINDVGSVVGAWSADKSWATFLWENGKVTDLSKLVKFKIEHPDKINNKGDIVVMAYADRSARLILLRR